MGTKISFNQIDGMIISVKDFGAVGDGITDDTAAIQRALDTGLDVLGQSGTYLINATLTMSADNQRLLGQGAFTLKSSGLAPTSPILMAKDLNGARVQNVFFDCNGETYIGFRSTVSAGATGDFEGVEVSGCFFGNTYDTATSLYGALLCDNLAGAAFTYQMKGVNLHNNTFDNDSPLHSSHGCLVAYCEDVVFRDNVVKSAGFHGMEAVGCSGVVISGNTVRDCFESGLGVGSNTKNFLVSGNLVTDCDGDGSVTVEQNSVQGEVTSNVLTGCTNNGINISFGTAGPAPFNEVNNISVSGNLVMASPSGEGRIGINAYSSTGGAIGTGLQIKDNIFDGFATGIECTWLDFGQVTGNTVRRLGNVSVGRPDKTFMTFVGCDKMTIDSNTCDTEPTLHAITIDTSTVANSRFIVSNNMIQSATAGALIRKVGSGDLTAVNNKTFGAINYVSCDGTQNVTMSGNVGPLTGDNLAGGTLQIGVGGLSQIQELTGAGAVDVTSSTTHLITTGVNALTLADGEEQQQKFVVMKVDAGEGNLTPDNLANGTTIIFDDVGDSAHLLYTNSMWHFLGGTATLT